MTWSLAPTFITYSAPSGPHCSACRCCFLLVLLPMTSPFKKLTNHLKIFTGTSQEQRIDKKRRDLLYQISRLIIKLIEIRTVLLVQGYINRLIE